jgi:hypothetical protein
VCTARTLEDTDARRHTPHRRPHGDLGCSRRDRWGPTIISPALQSELSQSITEADDVAKGIQDFYEAYANPADSFARMVAFAITSLMRST